MIKQILFIIIISIVVISCQDEQLSPKPKGYFRVNLPERTYSKFDKNYPYSFDYSSQSLVLETNKDSFWVNLFYPYYKATLYLTYKNVNADIQPLMEQSRKYAYKHSVKADAINETVWINDVDKTYGILYDIKGNAASPLNFYLTDSTKHFISGSLYFDVKPNKDSLAPIVEYIREDIITMVESLKWKN